MRIRARFSVTTTSKATATITVVGAVRALVSIAKEITAPKAAAAVTAGILAVSAAYAAPKYSAVDAPRLRAEVAFPVQFIDGVQTFDSVAIAISTAFLDVPITGDSIDYYTFVKVLNDSVVVTDSVSKTYIQPTDFDKTDADVDPDPVFATDFPRFNLSRPNIADTVSTSDLAAKHPTKVTQDVATTSDGIDYLVVSKVLVDTAVPTDVINSFVLVRPDVADTATASDADAKQVTKPDLASGASASDLAAKHPQPVYTDTVTTADALTLAAAKVLTDTANTSDADAKTLVRPDVADVATATDADAKQITKPDVADSVTATDSAALHPQSVATDTATATDAIDYRNATKVLADTATTSDANAKTLTRPDVADSIATSDSAIYNSIKALTDSATATDAINSFTATTVLSDTATASDANAKTVTAVLADAVTVTESLSYLNVPTREFSDSSAPSDTLTIGEFASGVDSRAINGMDFNKSQLN